MNKAERQLEEARDRRNSARARLDARLATVRADVEARGVGGRIVDKAAEEARDAMAEALAVARESKGIIAGTAAALALWFLRNPIIAWAEELLAQLPGAHLFEQENSSE
jgi:hypothetical protein